MKKSFMFLSLISIVAFGGSAQADRLSAAEITKKIPDCWKGDDVFPGQFQIHIATKTLAKDDLIELLEKANEAPLSAQTYPTIVAGEQPEAKVESADSQLTVYVSSYDVTGKLGEDQLKAKVKRELRKFAKFDEVTLSCNYKVRPLHTPTQP